MLAQLRDLSIIVLAIESIVILVMLGVLIVQVTRLMRMLREEVLPILNSAQETVSTVRGTTEFVGDHVVRPVVGLASSVAGARQAARYLLRGSRGR